jgi:Leucine-rich repeat (LRR) protein
MDLSYSQNLINTPDFIGFRNLERLIFQGCTRLYKIHPSVGALRRLTLLNLKDCKRLKSLPHKINLESLEIFILSGCSRLKKFSEIGRNMTCLSELYLDGTDIEELPSSTKFLTSLTLLNLRDCCGLLSFPSVICSLTSLEILTLSGCRSQPPKPSHLLRLFPILSSIGVPISFKGIFSLLILSFLVLPYNYTSIFICATLVLGKYCIFNSRHPEPEPINLLLPKLYSGLSSLKSLDLSNCNLSDGALPDDLSCLSSLQSLKLSKNNFTHLPDSFSQLSKLKLLYLDNCSKLRSLPCLPLSTNFVMARGCTSLESYSNKVVVWTSCETGFTLINCLRLVEDEEGKITDVVLLDSLLEDEGGKITEGTLPDMHFRPLWQRYMEVSLTFMH